MARMSAATVQVAGRAEFLWMPSFFLRRLWQVPGMDRSTFRRLADLRLAEAQHLVAGRQYSGAYYLAGYAVECALKAVIMGQFRSGRLPSKQLVQNTYTHNIEGLVKTAQLGPALTLAQTDAAFDINWGIVKDWSESSRYVTWTRAEAVDLLSAIADQGDGVLPWIKLQW